jgi:hypothetical protein
MMKRTRGERKKKVEEHGCNLERGQARHIYSQGLYGKSKKKLSS